MGMIRSNRQRPPPPISPNPTPWLVFPHEFKSKSKPKAIEKQTFCTTTPSPHNNKFYLKSIPELQGKCVLGCYHGWLLLMDRHITDKDNLSLSLWNPVSFQTVSLPPIPNEFGTPSVASVLTCPPEDEGCFIVLVSRSLAAFCRPGDVAWVVQTPRMEDSDEELNFIDVTVCNGVLYGWVQGFSLSDGTVVIEINSDGSNMMLSFRFLGLFEIQYRYLYSPRTMTCMAECCEEVYLIQLSLDFGTGKRILGGVVGRLDLARMAWIEVNSLKGHVFFMGNQYSVSCHVESDSGGGLYFVLPEDTMLYFYKFEDASVTPVFPCANLKTPWLDPFWVLPRYPRSLVPKEIECRSIEGSCKEDKLDNLKDHQTHELADSHHTENETKDTIFSTLPPHLITLIAEHLALFDYLDLRSACKELRAAFPPIKCRTTTTIEVRNHLSSPPLLMLLNNHRDHIEENGNGDPLLWDVMDPSRLDVKYPMSIPKSFEGATITFSNNGWLLVRKYMGDSLQFLNPFTRASGECPQYDLLFSASAIGFSSTPTSPDCIIVGICDFGINEVLIRYFQQGDERSNLCTFDLHEKGFRFPHGSNCPAYYDGAFYFLDKKGYLGVFELQGGEARWRVFDKHVPMQSMSFNSSCIVECDGHIVVVVVGHMGKWVDVFRWNPEEEGWNKVESLGDQTIFVNPYSCFSTETRRPKMANKIYFPRSYGGRIAFYSMETKKWHCGGSEEPLSDFQGTMEFLNCCWIEPSWSH